ncbi:MAG: glycosyltransferase [Chloroflexi bacterium]|nr:glycosyltransferase [Chloroflexota bacterium]
MLKISCIVISFNPAEILERCLANLEQQVLDDEVELLVVGKWGGPDSEYRSLQQQFPKSVWISVPQEFNIPQMRALGMARSQAEIIAILEDDCLVSNDWCTEIIKAHKEAYAAIGGAVEPGDYTSSLDWSIYFCEYARFMLPFSGGEVNTLPGNNVMYKRDVLMTLAGEIFLNGGKISEVGFYEIEFNNKLIRNGFALKTDPSLIVKNIHSWRLSDLFKMPFHHGRGFAGKRFSDQDKMKRVLYLGITFLLPVVQVIRILKLIIQKRRYLRQFLFALPGIIMFFTSWSIGEFFGYLLGPGNSLQEWK